MGTGLGPRLGELWTVLPISWAPGLVSEPGLSFIAMPAHEATCGEEKSPLLQCPFVPWRSWCVHVSRLLQKAVIAHARNENERLRDSEEKRIIQWLMFIVEAPREFGSPCPLSWILNEDAIDMSFSNLLLTLW